MISYILTVALVALSSANLMTISSNAVLVQPNNHMLDDSALTNKPDGGSLSPFYSDQGASSEHSADRDIMSILGLGLERIRFARMLDQQQQSANEEQLSHFSPEVAELIHSEHQQRMQEQADKLDSQEQQDQSLSQSVANVLINVAQVAAAAQQPQDVSSSQSESNSNAGPGGEQESQPSSSVSSSLHSQPSKMDLKSGPIQWYNPKETIPVLKISSMATPSKYKKVYYRSEKKLVDGAFHSIANEKDNKKSVRRSLISGVERRSSRGTASSSPPALFQDGVVEFLKKFRDVYLQMRPINTASGSSASSLASVLAPAPGSSRPSLASALQAASSVVSSMNSLSQAASSPSATVVSPSGAAVAPGAAASIVAAAAGGNPSKSPLSAQTYVDFWSKTFPTWVRKVLKQMRRRSLYNSQKRQQQHHHHHHNAIGQAAQAAASSAVASVVDQVTGSERNGGASSSSSSH